MKRIVVGIDGSEQGWMAPARAAALERAKDFGVEIDPVIKRGQPADALAELAATPGVTMLVVGHRGRNLAARLLIGSVADRLVQLSPVPVLVVR